VVVVEMLVLKTMVIQAALAVVQGILARREVEQRIKVKVEAHSTPLALSRAAAAAGLQPLAVTLRATRQDRVELELHLL
jgi:hypothetical protein